MFHEASSSVVVSLLPQRVVFTYNPNVLDHFQIKRAIEDAGFDVLSVDTVTVGHEESMNRTKLLISGMTCASCVATIETNLRKLDGVEGVSISLLSRLVIYSFKQLFLLTSNQ